MIIASCLTGSLLFLNACSLFKPVPSPPSANPPVSSLPTEESPSPDRKEMNPPEKVEEIEAMPVIDENSIQGTGSKKKYAFGVLMTTDRTQPGVPIEWQRIFNQYNGYFVIPTQEKKVFLTFDLGYEAGFTGSLLDTLDELNIPATFFLLGQYMEKNPDIVKRIVQDGYSVGNHSYYHENIYDFNVQDIIQDTQKCQTLFHQLTNRTMRFYRFPKGEFSEYAMSVIQRLGYKTFFWSIAYKDWEKVPEGPDGCYKNVMDHIHPGAIVLMHAVSDDNILALPRIVQSLTEQGYTFASLDEL